MDAPTKSNPPATGTVASQLSREIVRHHARLCGRGPTRARSYLERDFAICVIEDIFTGPERTLIETGAGADVRETRQALLAATGAELEAIFEQATGRSPRLLVTQTEVEADLGVLIAFFDPAEGR